MKNIILILTVVFLAAGTTDAYSQSWLEKLGKKAVERGKERAKEKVENKVEETVDKTVDGVFYAAGNAVKGGDKNKEEQAQVKNDSAAQQQQQQPVSDGNKPTEMAYAKSDFVPGDVIIFEDLMDDEQLGEFPSMWDLKEGSAEVASINGKKAIFRSDKEEGTYTVGPLMKNPNNYLPEKYTVEMDLWMAVQKGEDETAAAPTRYSYELCFNDVEGHGYEVASIKINNHGGYNDNGYMEWNYTSTSDASIQGNSPLAVTSDGWHHLAVSFNKRAFKIYLDGVRIANIPNMKQAANFTLRDVNQNYTSWAGAITNVRIAEGAVPLYDRMMTDGKFITYGITFDVGKATIKPESMTELTRIVQLLNENPTLKFSVEGHTDNTGNAASNQTLSEQRSQAVVAKLTEMGIAADRLTASGKGQNAPIADNNSPEGRAKNRRVEFVKL